MNAFSFLLSFLAFAHLSRFERPRGIPKAEEAVSPAEESIDLVGLEQTELVLLAPDEIGTGRGDKG